MCKASQTQVRTDEKLGSPSTQELVINQSEISPFVDQRFIKWLKPFESPKLSQVSVEMIIITIKQQTNKQTNIGTSHLNPLFSNSKFSLCCFHSPWWGQPITHVNFCSRVQAARGVPHPHPVRPECDLGSASQRLVRARLAA